MEILNVFGNEASWTETGMQPFRKSKARLLSGLLALALVMYYLLPDGHFLTEHTFSALTVGLDTKELFAWALFHFLQGLEGNMYKIWCWSREPEQMISSPSHQHMQLSTAWQNWLLSCSLLLGFFMTLFKILKPRLLRTLTHLLSVPNAQAPCVTTGPHLPSPMIPSAPATGMWQQILWGSTSLASAFLIRMGRGELQ